MSTTTRKLLIIEKYTELCTRLKEYLTETFLPVLGVDVDVVDLLFYINLHFAGQTYRDGVKALIDTHNIKVADVVFEELFPLVEAFLIWLRALQ
jgi:uncharacterized protein (UPF0276 family)